jgi:hypothetical protein
VIQKLSVSLAVAIVAGAVAVHALDRTAPTPVTSLKVLVVLSLVYAGDRDNRVTLRMGVALLLAALETGATRACKGSGNGLIAGPRRRPGRKPSSFETWLSCTGRRTAVMRAPARSSRGYCECEHGPRSVLMETSRQLAPLKIETRQVLPQSVGVIGDLSPFAGTIEQQTAGS